MTDPLGLDDVGGSTVFVPPPIENCYDNPVFYAGATPGSRPTTRTTLSPNTHWDWLDYSANLSAGYADIVTFGYTDVVRELNGWNTGIDHSSNTYATGQIAGVLTTMAVGGAAAGATIAVPTLTLAVTSVTAGGAATAGLVAGTTTVTLSGAVTVSAATGVAILQMSASGNGGGHNPTLAPKNGYVGDFQSKNTSKKSGMFNSEAQARQLARQKLGANPVFIGDNKLRSVDGKWQYRAKPVDTTQNHVHLERIDPRTGEVLLNWHLNWPKGAGR